MWSESARASAVGSADRAAYPTVEKTPQPPQLEVVDRGPHPVSRAFLAAVVEAVRTFAGRPDLHVSLLLTDDAEIGSLHAQHLGDPSPTDVMSFDLDGDAEVVVSVETAAREARADHPVAHEVALYVVHGLLHLCGFDDHSAGDRARMRAAERAVLDAVGVRVRDVDA